MPARGKPGNPTAGFPLFPPSLEIAARFPHSHTHDDSSYNPYRDSEPTPQKCYPCPRIEVLPMFPVGQNRFRATTAGGGALGAARDNGFMFLVARRGSS